MAKIRSDGDMPFQGATQIVRPVVVAAEAPPADWNDMSEAPHNRPIFLTKDPAADPGLLCQWRTTRAKNKPPERGWSPRSFWAQVLNKREIDFTPYCWREAMASTAAALREMA